MTMDERVEAAARAAYEAEPFLDVSGEPIPWAQLNDHVKQFPKRTVAPIVAAAFPELTGDKPTHWVAPMEATSEMLWRARAALRKAGLLPAYTDESTNGAPPIMNMMLEEAAWPAMRDAYLSKGDT